APSTRNGPNTGPRGTRGRLPGRPGKLRVPFHSRVPAIALRGSLRLIGTRAHRPGLHPGPAPTPSSLP
ncbi:MAG: hypothetical protein ACK56I_22025, partial [bacterium]